MKEIVLKRYELNEGYHDAKVNTAWTAASLYLAFSVAVVKWLLDPEIAIDVHHYVVLIVLLLAVYLAALAFTAIQFRCRWESVIRAEVPLGSVLPKRRKNSSADDLPPMFVPPLCETGNRRRPCERRSRPRCRWTIAEGTVRSFGVVVPAPLLQQSSYLPRRAKLFPVQELIARLAVE